MKKYIVLFVTSIVVFLGNVPVFAQLDQTPEFVLEENLKKPFPTVWKAIHKALETINCRVETEKKAESETGLFKGNIRTENWIFITGEDSSLEILERYGVVPTIRAGRWVSGRAQLKFIIKEKDDETTDVRLTTEISGFEEYGRFFYIIFRIAANIACQCFR
ncbi:MAG: hypothetical protein HYZ54_05100 [Ignavibacteriae bacterium]|nr:hypothetical protein [Ignavibacteriota bacterium]